MTLHPQRLTLIVLGVCFMITLATNLRLLWSNPNSLQMVNEPSLYELALASKDLAHIVFFGVDEFYDAEQITVSPDAAQTLLVDEKAIRLYSSIETVLIRPISDSRVIIPTNARVYPNIWNISITFIPTESSRLQVIVQDYGIIVMEQAE